MNLGVLSYPLVFGSKGFWASRRPGLFDKNSLLKQSVYSDNSKGSKLLSSLDTIENFLSYLSFLSSFSKNNIIQLQFLINSLGEFKEDVSDNILISHIDGLVSLSEEIFEIGSRLLEAGEKPYKFHGEFSFLKEKDAETFLLLSKAFSFEVKRANQIGGMDNVAPVLSSLVDFRSHLNIITTSSSRKNLNGVFGPKIREALTSDDLIKVGVFYEVHLASLVSKYYSIPLASEETDRLPLRLFLNNIDILFDIKTEVIGKECPRINALRSYFTKNLNYRNVDFVQYFTELAEAFYPNAAFSQQWIDEFEYARNEVSTKLSQIQRESSVGLFEASLLNPEAYKPIEVEVALLNKTLFVYDRILNFKRPMMELAVTVSTEKMKAYKREDNLNFLRGLIENRKLFNEASFSDVDIQTFWNFCNTDNDFLFGVTSKAHSYAQFLPLFYKMRRLAEIYPSGKMNRAVAYGMYLMFKNNSTFSKAQSKYVSPHIDTLYRDGDTSFETLAFHDDPNPFSSPTHQDVIEFCEKHDLLFSQGLDAFVKYYFIGESFIGVPHGVVKCYLQYLKSQTSKIGVSEFDLVAIISGSHFYGVDTYEEMDYTTNTETTYKTTKTAAVFDPAINKYPQVKALYNRVESIASNPPSGVMSLIAFWKNVTKKYTINNIPLVKFSYIESDYQEKVKSWKELKARFLEVEKKVEKQFSDELYTYFTEFDRVGDDSHLDGTFMPIFKGQVVSDAKTLETQGSLMAPDAEMGGFFKDVGNFFESAFRAVADPIESAIEKLPENLKRVGKELIRGTGNFVRFISPITGVLVEALSVVEKFVISPVGKVFDKTLAKWGILPEGYLQNLTSITRVSKHFLKTGKIDRKLLSQAFRGACALSVGSIYGSMRLTSSVIDEGKEKSGLVRTLDKYSGGILSASETLSDFGEKVGEAKTLKTMDWLTAGVSGLKVVAAVTTGGGSIVSSAVATGLVEKTDLEESAAGRVFIGAAAAAAGAYTASLAGVIPPINGEQLFAKTFSEAAEGGASKATSKYLTRHTFLKDSNSGQILAISLGQTVGGLAGNLSSSTVSSISNMDLSKISTGSSLSETTLKEVGKETAKNVAAYRVAKELNEKGVDLTAESVRSIGEFAFTTKYENAKERTLKEINNFVNNKLKKEIKELAEKNLSEEVQKKLKKEIMARLDRLLLKLHNEAFDSLTKYGEGLILHLMNKYGLMPDYDQVIRPEDYIEFQINYEFLPAENERLFSYNDYAAPVAIGVGAGAALVAVGLLLT